MSSLGIDGALTFTAIDGRATITDVTDEKNPSVVASNVPVHFTATAADKAHAASLGVTVWNANGGLWFSSAWDGTQTIEQPLDGGAIQIH